MSDQNNIEATYSQLKQQWNDADNQSAYDQISTQVESLANQGHGLSLVLLGNIYSYGENKNRDEIRAFEYYEKAVQMKVPSAFYRMGLAYAERENHEKAFQYYKEGTDLGCLDCMRLMGWALIGGKGTTKDSISGIRYIKKAADEGNLDAQYNYASLLIDGEVVKIDLDKAIEILEAVFKNKKGANTAFEIFRAYWKKYLENKSDESSRKKSDDWLKVAADLGNSRAKELYATDLKSEKWKSLENFRFDNESYYFWYKYGKVVNIRTETRSHTSSSGVGANTVRTTHTSWDVLELNDTEGNKFEVNPPSSVVISTGEEVEVAYICKGGETVGNPFLMVNKHNGKSYVIKTASLARAGVGYSVGCLQSLIALGAVFLGFMSLVMFSEGGFFLGLIALILFGGSITVLIKVYMKNRAKIDALADHIEKISNFLKQK